MPKPFVRSQDIASWTNSNGLLEFKETGGKTTYSIRLAHASINEAVNDNTFFVADGLTTVRFDTTDATTNPSGFTKADFIAQKAIAALGTDWTAVPGNSKEFTYFSDTGGGRNPSGNKNINTIVYKVGTTTVFTESYDWDADDDLVKVVTS